VQVENRLGVGIGGDDDGGWVSHVVLRAGMIAASGAIAVSILFGAVKIA
jgi:hypothetical protein